MMVVWIIGLLMVLYAMWLFKGTKTVKKYYTDDPEHPVLKTWHALLYLLGGLVPILGILVGLIMFIVWLINIYADKDWEYTRENKLGKKLLEILNKPIT